MSVKVHEPVCMDSPQDLYFWGDHFLGDQLKDEWNTTLVGGGTVAVVDAQTGGIVRLSTPTASDSVVLDWNDIRSLLVSKKVTIEARIRCNNGVTDTNRFIIGLYKDGNEYIIFFHGTDSTAVFIACRNVAQTASDSGIVLDADYHIYRIECFPTGQVHFYIDGVETANSPITTNIPDDAADYLQPFSNIITNADTDPATSTDIDYVVVRQER